MKLVSAKSASADSLAAGQGNDDRAFLGHPKGLGFLVFAESWERFSFYGMQALLVLYMSQHLLLPGTVENVAGFAPLRAGIEQLYGPLSPVALASAIFGLYAGCVYLTPIAGGFIADRYLGRTRTVSLGAILMAIGHFLMAFDYSFLMALACLLVGVGLFKGNIAGQVGELYKAGDLRRSDAFQIFLLGVNVAVIIAPLICGTLGQKVAWHWGFGAAGVGMLIGLVVYLAGRRWLPADRIRSRAAGAARPRLGSAEKRRIAPLVALLPVLAAAAVTNQQIFNAYLVWGEANYDLVFFGQSMPVTWLISLDAFIASGAIIATIAFWRWWSVRLPEPDEITKLTIGTFLSALAPLLLAAAAWQQAQTGEKIGLGWGIAFHMVNDFGFAMVFPVGIALFTRASPAAVTGLMIGIYYLHLFASNIFVGWLGGLLEKMPADSFWLMHAGIVAGAGAILLLLRIFFGHLLAPDEEALTVAAPVAVAAS